MTNGELSLLVLGGGPAGITAALQGRELGARVTLLEASRVGGTSLNRGPAPVRALARTARLVRDWSSWSAFGLRGPAPMPDLRAAVANSEQVASYAHEKKDMAGQLRRQGIDLIEDVGPAGFAGSHTLADGRGRTWTADRIILSVGGHPARLPIPGAEHALTYEDISSLTTLPERVAVVGGADTGCQIASIFADLGASVTVFEAGPVLIPTADASVSAELCGAFRARGMRVATSTMVESLSEDDDGFRVDYRCGEATGTATADAVFFAVGWPANIDSLDLDSVGVQVSSGAITVDDYLCTGVEHIFAAGDVTGRSKLVQSARMEGRIAAKNAILGPTSQASYEVVPSGSFTDPEYGRVGLTEAEAAASHEVVVGLARYDDLLRPIADGRPDGFCKLIVDRHTHAVLGAHVLGEYSAETVQTVAACMVAGLTVEQVAELQLAFPTFTEGISMAAQKICRTVGVGQFPEVWSYLGPDE